MSEKVISKREMQRIAKNKKEREVRNSIIDYIAKYQDKGLLEAFVNRNLQWFGYKNKLYEFGFSSLSDSFTVSITSKDSTEIFKFNGKSFHTICRMIVYEKEMHNNKEEGELLEYAKYEGYGNN